MSIFFCWNGFKNSNKTVILKLLKLLKSIWLTFELRKVKEIKGIDTKNLASFSLYFSLIL